MGRENRGGLITGRRSAYLLSILGVCALVLAAALLWMMPADSAQAQDDPAPAEITAGPVITSNPESGDAYGAGEAIRVAVTFSEPVTVTGKPRLRLAIGSKKRWARHDRSGEDGVRLIFTYKVKAADTDEDGVSIKKNSLNPNGGTIEDADGNRVRLRHRPLSDQAGHRVDGSPQEPEPTPTPTPQPPEPEQQQQAPANNEPEFAGETAARSVAENTPAEQAVGDPVTATDGDDDTLTYALTGSNDFTIDDSGQIMVASGATLDYETQAEYTVTVTVHDGKNAEGEADAGVDDSIEVAISVADVDEAGRVSLISETEPPQAGSELSAILLDPDGGVTGLAWVWERSADQTAWEAIEGTSGDAYTPTEDDAGKYLRATASYADGHGPGKSAQAATATAIAVALPPAEPVAQPHTIDPTIWSATLTTSGFTGDRFGCNGDCSTALTDNEFTYGGVTYGIQQLYSGQSNSKLFLRFSGDPPRDVVKTALWPLNLHVDGKTFRFADIAEGTAIGFVWRGIKLNWSRGQKVELSIAPAENPPPRVTNIEIISKPPAYDTYRKDEQVRVKVTFSGRNLTLDRNNVQGPGPTLTLKLNVGSDVVQLPFRESKLPGLRPGTDDQGAHSDETVAYFTYRVGASHTDTNGISIPENPLVLASGATFRDDDGRDVILDYHELADDKDHKVDGSRSRDQYGVIALSLSIPSRDTIYESNFDNSSGGYYNYNYIEAVMSTSEASNDPLRDTKVTLTLSVPTDCGCLLSSNKLVINNHNAGNSSTDNGTNGKNQRVRIIASYDGIDDGPREVIISATKVLTDGGKVGNLNGANASTTGPYSVKLTIDDYPK